MKSNKNSFGYTYYVNERKRSITCRYRSDDGTWYGVARCNKDDKFNIELGKSLAKKRVLLKATKCRLEDHKNNIGDLNRLNRLGEYALELLDLVKSNKDKYIRLKEKIKLLEAEIEDFTK